LVLTVLFLQKIYAMLPILSILDLLMARRTGGKTTNCRLLPWALKKSTAVSNFILENEIISLSRKE